MIPEAMRTALRAKVLLVTGSRFFRCWKKFPLLKIGPDDMLGQKEIKITASRRDPGGTALPRYISMK